MLLVTSWSCTAGPTASSTGSPRSDSGRCLTSGLVWSIVVFDGTTPFAPAELRVGQTLGLEASTVAIGCTVGPFTGSWTSSKPEVAALQAQASSGTSATPGRYAALLGVATGTTVVEVQIVGSDGGRTSARREFRVF